MDTHLPSLAALSHGEIGVLPIHPDDVLTAELTQLALTLDIKAVQSWLVTHREFSRQATIVGVWQSVLQELGEKYPDVVEYVDQSNLDKADPKMVWLELANRFRRCGGVFCAVRVLVKWSGQNPAKGRFTMDPVTYPLAGGGYPCDLNDGCVNRVLWHACIPRADRVVYADHLQMVPASTRINSQDFKARHKAFLQSGGKDGGTTEYFEKSKLTVSVEDLPDLDRELATNKMWVMSMYREETQNWYDRLGDHSCEQGMYYFWKGPLQLPPALHDALSRHHKSPGPSRWWYYIGLRADEPEPNRLRLCVGEFGLWREDKL